MQDGTKSATVGRGGGPNRRGGGRRKAGRNHPDVVAVPRPDVVPGGRLRVVDFPSALPAFELVEYPLRVQRLTDVLAMPVTGTREEKLVVGAAYDRNGDLLVDTTRSTRRGPWGENPAHLDDLPWSDATPLRGRTLFGGRISHHFGHVLMETLTLSWPELDYDDYDQILLYPNRGVRRRVARISPVLTTLLAAAGIPVDKVTVVGKEPLRIENLDLPTAPFRMADSADPHFLVPFDRIRARVERDRSGTLSDLPARIYLSRSQLSEDKRRATNEAELEELMNSRGFAVVHPQQLSFDDQVALLRRAEVIAGCDGSALHLAVFARPGAKLLAIDTRPVVNQFLIDQARELDAIHIWGATDIPKDRLAPWQADLRRIAYALDLLLDEGSAGVDGTANSGD